MLVTSIFFFSHNVFYPMKDNFNVLSKLSSVNAFYTEQKWKRYGYILAQTALFVFFRNKMKSHMKISSFFGFHLLETYV